VKATGDEEADPVEIGGRPSSGHGGTGVTKTAIIGLDGATFRLLEPLFEDGAMPALAALRARGVSGVLSSTTPAYTPPAWVSMLTGVNPGRHNVYGFLSTTPQEEVKIAHSGTIAATPIWRFANDRETSIGVYNVPMTYPPAEVANGFMVSGGLAAGWTSPDVEGFASDPEIARIVAQVSEGAYPIDTVVSYENDWSRPEIIDEVERIQRMRRKVLNALLEHRDVEFLFSNTSTISTSWSPRTGTNVRRRPATGNERGGTSRSSTAPSAIWSRGWAGTATCWSCPTTAPVPGRRP
jgi:predicted AlkP superfamily phosphohydrolase/phosphomutase